MKKFIFSLVAMLTMALATVNAQSQSNYAGSSKFFDNWSIGINGGIQTNLHDWQCPQGAVVGVTLDKEITPLFGITAEVGTSINNRGNWTTDIRHLCNDVTFDQLTVMADGRFNLTNAILGYKGSRRFIEIETVTGVGYGHGYASVTSEGTKTDALLVKGGVNVNFNLSDAFTINVRPAVIWNVSQTGQFDSRYAVGQITAGLTYHFKTSNGTRHIAKAKLFNQSEIDALNAQITDLKAELAKRPTVVEKIITKEVNVDKTTKITFDKNSSTLSNGAKAALDNIAKGSSVTVIGTASPEGTEARNTELSNLRAKVVADYLQSRGVNVVSALGGEAGRTAVVTVQ